MVAPWLADPNKGRTWDPPPAAAVGEALGAALVLCALLPADTGLSDTRVSVCLSPAFGLTLHLIPGSLANPRGLPVSRESWLEAAASVLD